MRLTSPTATAKVGDVEVRGVQRVIELDAGDTTNPSSPQRSPPRKASDGEDGDQRQQRLQDTEEDTQAVPPQALRAIEARTAIVVPCKDEDLARIEGVWSAIPSASLVILVSASQPEAYAREKAALASFCRATGRDALAVHQSDAGVAAAFRSAGMAQLLDPDDGLVHRGKGEAMLIGLALAATARPATPKMNLVDGEGGDVPRTGCCDQGCSSCDEGQGSDTNSDSDHDVGCRTTNGKGAHSIHNPGHGHQGRLAAAPPYYKYIGFVDADNFVPGSVHEYCKVFSAGLHLADPGADAMVRISWASKPKIRDGRLDFKPLGRSSEIVNRWLNRLLDEHVDVVTYRSDDDYYQSTGKNEGGNGLHEEGGTSLICTGNAGEHAMTMSLALKLRLASGYAIEPFHFLDIFERFGCPANLDAHIPRAHAEEEENEPPANIDAPGAFPTSPASTSPSSPLLPPSVVSSGILSSSPDLTAPSTISGAGSIPACLPLRPDCDDDGDMDTGAIQPSSASPQLEEARAKVQILQIQTRNPHFHDDKGEAHVVAMWRQALAAMWHSPLTGETERALLGQAILSSLPSPASPSAEEPGPGSQPPSPLHGMDNTAKTACAA